MVTLLKDKLRVFLRIIFLVALVINISCNDFSTEPHISKSKIVYISDKGGKVDSIFTSYKKHDIFIMDSDGSNQINLTNQPDVDFTSFILSPNQDKILYRNVRPGVSNYHIMNIDGTEKRELTSTTHGNFGASFSPDGNSIVYISQEIYDQQYSINEIVIIDINGNKIKNLTKEINIPGAHPKFSPDGEKICFSGSVSNFGNSQIFIVDKDGSNLKQLTSGTLSYYNQIFSKDGQKIFFTGNKSDEGMEIFSINIDGSDFSQLTNSGFQSLYGDMGFSPKGDYLIFINSGNIVTLNLDGQDHLEIISSGHSPIYTEEGNKILFNKQINDLFQIFEMNSDGSNQINLSNNNYNNTSPVPIYFD